MAEKQGRTLWEVLMDKLGFGEPKPLPPWQRICNPLEVKPGKYVTIDLLDFRDKNYKVVEVAELVVTNHDRPLKFAEYTLACGDEQIWLRLIPARNGLKALVGTKYDAFGADTEDGQAIMGLVKDPKGEFHVDPPGTDIHETYWRVDDVKSSYVAKVTVVTSDDESAEPETCEIEYWDYWRTTQVDGVDTTQYFYIEQNTDNGWMNLKRFEEAGPEQVATY